MNGSITGFNWNLKVVIQIGKFDTVVALIKFKAISQSLAILFLSFPFIYGLMSIKAHCLQWEQYIFLAATVITTWIQYCENRAQKVLCLLLHPLSFVSADWKGLATLLVA